MIEILLFGSTLCYAVLFSVLHIGLSRVSGRRGPAQYPSVSIIVAARNEEENITHCLASLLDQSFPGHGYEIIVVDDESTDRTEEIVREISVREPRVRLLNAVPHPTLRGKANALAQGIEVAAGEVLLITDADCRVPRTWIEEITCQYEEGVGLVSGITLVEERDRFSGMQALDWAYLLGVAAAAAALHVPLTSIGNNLSFRRAAYNDVGGYRNLPFSVTEDYVLYQAITRSGKWKYRSILEKGATVLTEPCKSWKQLLGQKRRWGKGGLEMRPEGLILMAVTYATHAFLLLQLLCGGFSLAVTLFFGKTILDYSFLFRVLQKVDRRDLLKYFYLFVPFYFFYVLALPFLVAFGGTISWKGRTY